MAHLILRNIPPELHSQLKHTATENRRSMNQQAILALEAGLRAEVSGAPAPTLEESLDWLRREAWPLPARDYRSADDIIGYGADGLCD